MTSRTPCPSSSRVTYRKKLLDPRWQKKRLAILERDGWECQCCTKTEETLHVHHRWYAESGEPWDVPDEALVTLCEGCHQDEGRWRREAEMELLKQLRKLYLFCHIEALTETLIRMPPEASIALAEGAIYPGAYIPAEEWLRKIRQDFHEQLDPEHQEYSAGLDA